MPIKVFQLFSRILQLEEEYIQNICDEIIAFKPDLLITEKGVSDLAQHYLVKAGISVIRRVRKSDNNRIARSVCAYRRLQIKTRKTTVLQPRLFLHMMSFTI